MFAAQVTCTPPETRFAATLVGVAGGAASSTWSTFGTFVSADALFMSSNARTANHRSTPRSRPVTVALCVAPLAAGVGTPALTSTALAQFAGVIALVDQRTS